MSKYEFRSLEDQFEDDDEWAEDTNTLITCKGTLIHQTSKAYLVDFGLDKEVWIPLSCVQYQAGHKRADGTEALDTFKLPLWLARSKGLL